MLLLPPVLLGLVAATALAQNPAAATTVELIDNVTVIDGTGAAPLRDAAVLLEGGRIRQVGPRAAVRVPPGARRTNGGGGYLLPGFVEMHAHVSIGPVELDRSGAAPTMRVLPDSTVVHRTLALLLANGVTTARDPSGAAVHVVAVRDSVSRGLLAGPRLFVAGEVIDRVPFAGLSTAVKTPDEVRAEVRRQALAGVDMIKLYAYLTPDLMEAGIQEAHRHGLPAISHAMFTTWTEAARLGLDGIVHVSGWSPRLLPVAARQKYAAMMAAGPQFMYGWFELADPDGPELGEAIGAVVARRMHLDPTLVVFERAVRGDDPAITQSPALRDAAPALLRNWRDFFSFSAGWTPEDYTRARAAWPRALRLTRMLWERGALLTAGTDANNPWVVPGESFHRELELLVEAGIPPLDVIRIATRNGAEALGILGEAGTIEAGKVADLVLLRADPSASISATRQVAWVMRSGTRYLPGDVLRAAGLR